MKNNQARKMLADKNKRKFIRVRKAHVEGWQFWCKCWQIKKKIRTLKIKEIKLKYKKLEMNNWSIKNLSW